MGGPRGAGPQEGIYRCTQILVTLDWCDDGGHVCVFMSLCAHVCVFVCVRFDVSPPFVLPEADPGESGGGWGGGG